MNKTKKTRFAKRVFFLAYSFSAKACCLSHLPQRK